VLLKNDGALLPLRSGKKRILVTGPLADSRLILGDWATTVQQRGVETVLEAFRRLAPRDVTVEHEPCGTPLASTDAQLKEACRRAGRADVVLACVGENSFRWSAEPKTSGENCDRADLGLPGRQEELLEGLAAAGKPVVTVLFTSRANAVARWEPRMPAILMAWEPGMYAGEAVVRTLLGQRCPSGRLPVSMPRSSGHLRCLYDRPPLRLPHYGDSEESPLFPFGHGLSYAPVRLENVEHPATVRAGEALPLELDVVNGGTMETDHVVLAFLRDMVGSVTTPERRLCAFRRVEGLLPGERRRVRLSVEPERMALVDADGGWRIEPGRFEIRLETHTTAFDVL
jgi:beta-glucosidase